MKNIIMLIVIICIKVSFASKWNPITAADSVLAFGSRDQLDSMYDADDKKEMMQAEAARLKFIKKQKWSKRVVKAAIAQKIFIGMTKSQVRASWGEPDRIHSVLTRYSNFETWCYSEYCESSVSFDNDKLSIISQ